MEPEEQFSSSQLQLMQWAAKTSHLICASFDECSKHFIPASFQDDRECLVLWQLAGSCHSTSESALVLVQNNRLWDADVLLRSVIEGTVKFIYLTIGSAPERMAKRLEFDDDLGAVGQLKRHQRLDEFLRIVENPNADEWRPFRDLLLSDVELKQLQDKYPKTLRQKLNQKWSYAELSIALRSSKEPVYGVFGHMLYNYGMSSHIAHQDIDGIGMVWDRNGRDEVRRTAVELSHAGRMISEVAIMALLRAKALFKFWNIESSTIKSLYEDYQSLIEETKAAHKHFHDIEYPK